MILSNMNSSNQYQRAATLCLSALMAIGIAAGSIGCTKKKRDDAESKKAAPQAQAPVSNSTPAPGAPADAPVTIEDNSGDEVAEASGDSKPALESEYDPMDPKNLTRADLQKRLTGGVESDGMVYTDASEDYLITFLRNRFDAVENQVIRERNLKLAQSILDVKVSKEASGRSLIRIKMKVDKKERVTILTGDFDANLRYSKVSGSGGNATVPEAVVGELRCLDLNQNSCETAFLRLMVGQPGQRATAAVVLRDTTARLNVSMNLEEKSDPVYSQLRDLMVASMFNASGEDKLKPIQVTSFVVANGRSAMKIRMISEQNEILVFSSKLLSQQGAGSEVNLAVDRNLEFEDMNDIENMIGRSTKISDSIKEVRMVNNNGLGQVKFKLMWNNKVSQQAQAISFHFMREVKPLLFLSEDSIFFDSNQK